MGTRIPPRVVSAITEPAAAGDSLSASLGGVARLAASTLSHTTVWGVTTSARLWGRVAKSMISPKEMAALSDDLGQVADQIGQAARILTRNTPVSQVVDRWGLPALEWTRDALLARGAERYETSEPERLRSAGEDLLRASRDVWSDDERHPAYAAILRDLAPDEARILVFLLKSGPQPSIDVHLGGLIGRLSTERVLARGLTMIGLRASVRHRDAVPKYLNNLTRLGLIWMNPEPVPDLLRYQVVEVQPDVLAAVHSVRKSKMVRKSVHLTPFGQDFARVCFADVGELALLPAHDAPPDAVTVED